MDKSLFTREYVVVLTLLQELRAKSQLTQIEFAKALGQSQSFVSKCERGERRLDIIQLRTICQVLGTTLPAFIQELERRLAKLPRS